MFGRSSRSQSQTLLDGKPAVFNENVANKGVTTRSSRPALKELTNQNQIPKIKDDKKEADKKTSVLAPHNPNAIPKQTSVVPVKQTAIAPSNKDVFAHPNNVSKQENKPQPPQAKIPEDIDVEDLESGSDEEENSEEEETQEQFDAMDIEALGDGTNLEVYEENSMDEEAPPILDASVEDIDSCDIDDPQFCSEYVHLVFKYLRKVEEKLKPDSNYMEKQKDVSEKHRAVLVDWLVEVGSNFKLLTETMFLTIHILDRFLSIKSVTRSKLQLVGMTAMLIASKIEEIYTPQVKDFVCICASAYDASEILATEKQMLIALGFNLNAAHALHFLRRFSKAGHADSKTHTLAKYIIELSLLEYKMLQYLPSKVAASAVYISRKMCNIKPLWNKTLSYHAGYTESEIMDCIIDLNEIVKKQSPDGKTKSVYKKYASSKFLSVALIPPVSI